MTSYPKEIAMNVLTYLFGFLVWGIFGSINNCEIIFSFTFNIVVINNVEFISKNIKPSSSLSDRSGQGCDYRNSFNHSYSPIPLYLYKTANDVLYLSVFVCLFFTEGSTGIQTRSSSIVEQIQNATRRTVSALSEASIGKCFQGLQNSSWLALDNEIHHENIQFNES